MNASFLKKQIHGIVPPVVTPLSESFALDLPALSRLLEHLIEGGVHALFLLGTTGEGPALSYQTRRKMIAESCRIVHGRVPILVAISDTSLQESISLGHWANQCGANALVVSAPYYFAVSQNDLYEMIAELSASLSLPVYLYNMPSLTKASFDPETVLRCSKLPLVAGIKVSSGDMYYVRELVRAFATDPDFTILVGPEELLSESIQAGAHGGVNGGANLFPRLFVNLYKALINKDVLTSSVLQEKVCQLGSMLYHIGEPESSYIRGLKLGLEILGLCSSRMAPPFQTLHAMDFEDLKFRLRSFQNF